MTTRKPTLLTCAVRASAPLLASAGLVAALVALAGTARAADAGAAVTTGTSISPEYYAPRYLPGTNTAAPAHLNDFSPLAINYADCSSQIDIEFAIDLTDAPSADEIQVWAGSGAADCTQTSARTAGASSSPDTFPGRCWPVAAPGAFNPAVSPSSARLSVLDLVSHIGDPNPPVSYSAEISTSVCQPHATTTAVPLNIYFMFVPAGSGRGSVAPAPPDGVPGLYQTPAALVGPFAPTGVTAPNSGITANSLTVSWIPQAQSIIQGFNVYIEDQGPGGLKGGKPSADAGAALVYGVECHPARACGDAGTGSTKDAGTDARHDVSDGGVHDATLADAKTADAKSAARDAGVDAESDSGEVDGGESDAEVTTTGCDAGLVDAWVAVDAAAFAGEGDAALAAQGCIFTGPINVQDTTGTGAVLSCNSAILVDSFTVDGGLGGAASTVADSGTTGLLTTVSGDSGTTTTDAAADTGVISLTSTTETNVPEVAGISNISPSHLAFYAAGGTTNSYTINGLTTGDQYAVAVAAVDSYGNVGPLGAAISPITGDNTGGLVACTTPTPVDDFFTQYGLDGGTAGGGYCALTAVGAPAPFFASIFGAGFVGAAIGRGRRRRRERKRP